jgi:hypothetical protein
MNIKLEGIFLLVFLVFIGIAILIGTFWVINTEKRLKRFFLGKKAKDLEETIISMQNDIADLKKAREDLRGEMAFMDARIKKGIRKLQTIRFNPFRDQGGNQSFAIGMLNEEGDGIVLSSLYSRERMSIFAKPIKNNRSEFELSTEEKEVLEKAKAS